MSSLLHARLLLPSLKLQPSLICPRSSMREDQSRNEAKSIEPLIARGSRAFDAIDTCWAEFIRQYKAQRELGGSPESRQLMDSNLTFIMELRERVRESWTMMADVRIGPPPQAYHTFSQQAMSTHQEPTAAEDSP